VEHVIPQAFSMFSFLCIDVQCTTDDGVASDTASLTFVDVRGVNTAAIGNKFSY
jgi:hypothetical protein